MILRTFNLKKAQKSISTLSPKGSKRPTYMRFKLTRDKSSKGQRSLCSIDTYRQSNSLGSKRMLSHRKLISASSTEQKQNLTDRKCTNQETSRQRKQALQSERNQNIIGTTKNTKDQLFNKKRFHLNKFFNYRNDRLHTIQNEQTENIEKVLEIKENILKQFIDRFQEQLKEISQKKSSRKTLLTHRLKTENSKQQTAKKARTQLNSLQSNRQTLNLSKCAIKQNQQIPLLNDDNAQRRKFQEYIRSLKEHKKKDQKIFIMKNHKRSLQNISISKIGETQNVTSRVSKLQTKSKLNLKDLFKHSKKYQPYIKDSETLCLNKFNKASQIKQTQQKLEKSSFKVSPIRNKQNIEPSELSVHADCSEIQKLNQSSFISEVGRKSLLRHLQNESVKIIKEEQRKTKKCLAKIKNIFPSDFF